MGNFFEWVLAIGGILLILLFIVVAIVGSRQNRKDRRDNPEKYAAIKADIAEVTSRPKIALEYFYGHPDINNQMLTYLTNDGSAIDIIKWALYYSERPTVIATIPLVAIENVVVEDQSSIERKVTAGRLILAGSLAFAWKKKKVHEAAYLIIKWKTGRFEHETYFRKEGKGSLAVINAARNELIKWSK